MSNLSERDKEVIKEAIKEYNEEHPCHFDKLEERPSLHAFARACRIHNAKEDDILIMVFSAKTVGTLVKRIWMVVGSAILVIVIAVITGEIFRNPSGVLHMIEK